MALIDDDDFGIPVVALDERGDGCDLHAARGVCLGVVGLNDAVLDAELVQARGALLDEFLAMGEEEASVALADGAFDHGAGDGGFACAGRRDERDPPDALCEFLAEALDAGLLVVA